MTNEELTVLAGLASDLASVKRHRDSLVEEKRERHIRDESEREERNRILAECNRLRESEANALNAAEEAKRERDEARKKMRDYARFFYCTIYTALVRAIEMKDIRKIVKDAVKDMRDFMYEHPIEFNEGRMAK